MKAAPTTSVELKMRLGYKLRHGFVARTQRLVALFCDRIPGAFKTAVEEAGEVATREEMRYLEHFHSEPADLEDAMWHATDAYYDYLAELTDVEQAHRNLAAAGLYHLFEQQLAQVLIELGAAPAGHVDLKKAENSLKAAGIVNPRLTDGPIDELRLVANTVKHGEGGSSRELGKRRADVFRHEFVGRSIEPLAGRGLSIDVDQLRAYGAAIVQCWTGIADQLEVQAET